jgi:hypothetical protein
MRHFLFYPTDAGEKNEPRWRDGRPLARLGAWLLLSTGEVLLTGSRKIAHKKSATSFQAARRVENRHAGTGEVITASAQGWFVCYPRRHLWHL